MKSISRMGEHIIRVYQRHRRVVQAVVMTLILVFTVLFYTAVYRPPSTFVQGKIVEVQKGATLDEVAELLEEKDVVRSAAWLRGIIVLFGGERIVQAGDYYFHPRLGLGGVARMLITGDFGLTPLRITIPEGSSVNDVADILSQQLVAFDRDNFLRLAKEREGYLFPDTYFFLPTANERQVITIMSDTFLNRIREIDNEIVSFGRPIDEVITMASILEREAHDFEERRIIAGILWKRIELGMPLQVDATFDYINGKNTFELTHDDLEVDSPYNTYVYVGLPPGPIANPGLEAILAAVTPVETEYLYFLADRHGTVHYSETFEEHKRKKAMYLN